MLNDASGCETSIVAKDVALFTGGFKERMLQVVAFARWEADLTRTVRERNVCALCRYAGVLMRENVEVGAREC